MRTGHLLCKARGSVSQAISKNLTIFSCFLMGPWVRTLSSSINDSIRFRTLSPLCVVALGMVRLRTNVWPGMSSWPVIVDTTNDEPYPIVIRCAFNTPRSLCRRRSRRSTTVDFSGSSSARLYANDTNEEKSCDSDRTPWLARPRCPICASGRMASPASMVRRVGLDGRSPSLSEPTVGK
jgi:hypothetical protein